MLGEEGRDDVALSGPDGGMGLLFTNPGQFFSDLWAGLEPVFWPMFVGGLPLGMMCALICYFGLKPMIIRYKQRRARIREARAAANRARSAEGATR